MDYPEVRRSRAGRLYSLGVEVFGRWSSDAQRVVRDLARGCVRGLPLRVQLSTHTKLLRRWWGLLGLGVQRVVASSLLRDTGFDLDTTVLERPPLVADLPC